MLESGLLDEIQSLITRGYDGHFNALDSIGYKELIPVVKGEAGLDEGIAALKKNTRNLAKKQMTWFRRNSRIHWLEVDSQTNWDDLADDIVKAFCNK